jgi:MFS family permease
MAPDVITRRARTSWGAILDGWLATVGVAAILSPLVGLLLAAWYPTRGYGSAVPILVAVGISYLVGGYVAGRMSGQRTSWHGMLVAFLGIFIVLALLVVDVALALGVFGVTGRLVQIVPPVLGVALYGSVETFAFGGALGLLLAIFAGWLGGLLAPTRIIADPLAVPAADAAVAEGRQAPASVRRPRERYRLLPSVGRKGGEPATAVEPVEPIEPVAPVEPIEPIEPVAPIEPS